MQKLAALTSRIIRIAQRTLDTIFPMACPECGEAIDTAENPGIICSGCRTKITIQPMTNCSVCGALIPSLALTVPGGCYCCHRKDAPLTGIVTLGAYHEDERLSGMILAMKHGGKTWHSREFGWQLAERVRSVYPDKTWDAVIAVPLHRTRLWKRGYNQAALVAGYLGNNLGIPSYKWLLLRSKRTRPQSGGRSDRLRNIQGAFSTGGICRNARIILVDDVVTTGATTGECAAELYKAGAREVLVAACAWVPVLKDKR